jgi:hypothetical protein
MRVVYRGCGLAAEAAPDEGHSTRNACGLSVKDVPERFVKDVMELDT